MKIHIYAVHEDGDSEEATLDREETQLAADEKDYLDYADNLVSADLDTASSIIFQVKN